MTTLIEELKIKKINSELSNDEEMTLILAEVYEKIDNEKSSVDEIPEEDWEILW